MALTRVQSEMAGAGQVLQVVHSSTSTLVSNSTSTYIDSGLTATITPKSASSKILVLVNQVFYKNSSSTVNSVNLKLFRNSTDLGRILNSQLYTGTTIEVYGNGGFNYLDSPATTSSTTYKTQFMTGSNSPLVACQPDNIGVSTITLMEIAQ